MAPSPDRESGVALTRKEKKGKKPSYVQSKQATACSSAAASPSATMMQSGSGSIAGPSKVASSAGHSAAGDGSPSSGSSSAGPSATGLSLANLSLADHPAEPSSSGSSSSDGPSSPGPSSGNPPLASFLASRSAGSSLAGPSTAGPSSAGSSSAGPSAGPSAPMGPSAAAIPFPGPSIAGPSSSSGGDKKKKKKKMSKNKGKGKEVVDPARLAQAMKTTSIVRAHDEGRIKLWGTGLHHDVVIECQGATFKVHHEILTRESTWFRDNGCWPDDREGRVITVGMNSHDPMRLGFCIRFMYEKSYEFGTFKPDDPLSVNNMRTNVFMYDCATSIRYQNLMDFTVRNLYQYARDLKKFLATLPPAANQLPPGFVQELQTTLLETVNHTDNPLIYFQLRTAMASVMEVFLPWLRNHPAFVAAIQHGQIWKRLLEIVDKDIDQMNNLGHVYGDTELATMDFNKADSQQ
ncbi:hypothetical protein QBC39DRAFT_373346 [Podospora conica]|nr:hypothetical protein QBC39DRAFT_373346 [Schizothecium conicum]